MFSFSFSAPSTLKFKNSLSTPKSLTYSPILSSRSFIILFYPHQRIFLERKEGRETLMQERSIYWWFPIRTWTRGWTHNPGVYPDQELNSQPFGYGTTLQPTEPNQPGSFIILTVNIYNCNPLGVDFCIKCEVGDKIIFFPYGYPAVQNHLLKR